MSLAPVLPDLYHTGQVAVSDWRKLGEPGYPLISAALLVAGGELDQAAALLKRHLAEKPSPVTWRMLLDIQELCQDRTGFDETVERYRARFGETPAWRGLATRVPRKSSLAPQPAVEVQGIITADAPFLQAVAKEAVAGGVCLGCTGMIGLDATGAVRLLAVLSQHGTRIRLNGVDILLEHVQELSQHPEAATARAGWDLLLGIYQHQHLEDAYRETATGYGKVLGEEPPPYQAAQAQPGGILPVPRRIKRLLLDEEIHALSGEITAQSLQIESLMAISDLRVEIVLDFDAVTRIHYNALGLFEFGLRGLAQKRVRLVCINVSWPLRVLLGMAGVWGYGQYAELGDKAPGS